MPLWKATAQALAVLYDRCGEEIWPIVKAELDGLFDENKDTDQNPFWASHMPNPERYFQEDEKTWRNPGLNETLAALDGMGHGMLALVQVRSLK